MGFRENIIARAQDWVQGRLTQGADRAVVAQVLRGHLQRLRLRSAELEAALAYPEPAPAVVASFIDGVRREVEALIASVSGDAEVEVPADLFQKVMDVVVLRVDSQDEDVKKSGAEVFNVTIRNLPLMLAAEEEAVSARDAYARGRDLPRLLVGALAGLRKDLDVSLRELIPKDVGTPTDTGIKLTPRLQSELSKLASTAMEISRSHFEEQRLADSGGGEAGAHPAPNEHGASTLGVVV